MDKHAIIKLIEEGNSERKIARDIGINRKTIAKYRKEYEAEIMRLKGAGDIHSVQERIVSAPKYNTSNRNAVKYTEAVDKLIDEILKSEDEKDEILGEHKQSLTVKKIHKKVRDAGHDIGLTTVSIHVSKKRAKAKEAFIRQEYELGDRVEYDFGEAKLVIAGIKGNYHMAVFGAPAGRHRWAYLYDNQKKEVFQDSHIRYFERMGGAHDEVGYDNMRNVVSKFIGRNEKVLNEDLIKMSLYYGFKINVTNCFKGNEKGYVESSVKVVRREVFSEKYCFESLEEAEEYLHCKLDELNADSRLEEEKKHLQDYRPPLELAKLSRQKVDKYSFIRIENNFYSVPEHLVGQTVTIKNYLKEVIVYADSGKICEHKKICGYGKMNVDIFHYLDTFAKKPGALRNSKALKSKIELKYIFDNYFSERPREFIDILKKNRDKNYISLLEIVTKAATDPCIYRSADSGTIEDNVTRNAKLQLKELSTLHMKGGKDYVN